MDEKLGTVTIAPEVLVTIARLTTLSVPGVTRMSREVPAGADRVLHRDSVDQGIRIAVDDDTVCVDLYIIVDRSVNMLKLAQQVQSEVARAIHHMVGMQVREVNVYIQDVEPTENSPMGATEGEQ